MFVQDKSIRPIVVFANFLDVGGVSLRPITHIFDIYPTISNTVNLQKNENIKQSKFLLTSDGV